MANGMNKRRNALIVVPLILLAAAVGIWQFRTRATLKATEVGPFLQVREDLCIGDSQIFPSAARDPFPAYSPDGQYYVEVRRLWPWERRTRLIEMYEADSGDQVGRYVSSERSLLVFCWDEDSTGIFVADHSPGTGSLFIMFHRPVIIRPVVKLLVPE